MDQFVQLMSDVLGMPPKRIYGRQYKYGSMYFAQFAVHFGHNPYIDCNVYLSGELVLVVRARSNDQHWVYIIVQSSGSFNFAPIYRSMTAVLDTNNWQVKEETVGANIYNSLEMTSQLIRRVKIENKNMKIDYHRRSGEFIATFRYDFDE